MEQNSKSIEDEERLACRPEFQERFKDNRKAWVVLSAAAVAVLFASGARRSLAILFVDLNEVFDVSTTQSTILFSSFGVSYTASAVLLNTALGGFIQERALILFGVTMGSLGYIMTYFSGTLEYVTIGLSLCLGFASQTCISSGSSITGKYFKKRLNLANGIVTTGASVGASVLPILTRVLLDEYSYKGASLLLGGLMLNCVVCVGLMQPAPGTTWLKNVTKSEENFQLVLDRRETNYKHTAEEKENSDNIAGQDLSTVSDSDQTTNKDRRGSGNSMQNATFHRHTVCEFRDNFIESVKVFCLIRSSLSKRKMTLSQTFGISFLKNPQFLLFQLYNLTVFTAIDCLLQFYPAVSQEKGMSDYQSAFGLSLAGFTGLLARPVLGFVGDYFETKHRIVVASQTILGISVFLSCFATTFWSQIIYCVVVGVNYSTPYVFKVSLIQEFFGLQQGAQMIGSNAVMVGIGMILGSPVIGAIRDLTGSYLVPMYLTGSMFFIGSLVLLIMGCSK